VPMCYQLAPQLRCENDDKGLMEPCLVRKKNVGCFRASSRVINGSDGMDQDCGGLGNEL
jgi:hypothetical protein